MTAARVVSTVHLPVAENVWPAASAAQTKERSSSRTRRRSSTQKTSPVRAADSVGASLADRGSRPDSPLSRPLGRAAYSAHLTPEVSGGQTPPLENCGSRDDCPLAAYTPSSERAYGHTAHIRPHITGYTHIPYLMTRRQLASRPMVRRSTSPASFIVPRTVPGRSLGALWPACASGSARSPGLALVP